MNYLKKSCEPSDEKDVTSLYGTMIEAFSADFQLALYRKRRLEGLNKMIEKKNDRLMKDIDLLDQLDYGIRYGKIKIIEVLE